MTESAKTSADVDEILVLEEKVFLGPVQCRADAIAKVRAAAVSFSAGGRSDRIDEQALALVARWLESDQAGSSPWRVLSRAIVGRDFWRKAAGRFRLALLAALVAAAPAAGRAEPFVIAPLELAEAAPATVCDAASALAQRAVDADAPVSANPDELSRPAHGYGYDLSRLPPGASGQADAQAVLSAFADLPASVFDQDARKPRTVMRGTDAPKPINLGLGLGQVVAVAGEGAPGIVLQPGWDVLGPAARHMAVAHEVGHEFARRAARRFDWRAAWRQATYSDMVRFVDWRQAFVSAYAQTSLDEDFAESFAAYRYRPEDLNRRAPARYALLRQWAFAGAEYRSG